MAGPRSKRYTRPAALDPRPAPQLYFGFNVPLYLHEAHMQAFRWGLREGEHGGLGRYNHLWHVLASFWPVEVCTEGRLACKNCRTQGRMLHPPRWNPWTERTLRELCDDGTAIFRGRNRVKVTLLTGAASCSKTWTLGLYAFAWWICAPHESIVMFTSTTKDMIKRRIWPVVQHFHDTALDPFTGEPMPWPSCKKVESRTSIDYVNEQGTASEKNAIFAMAVAHGETQKAATNLRGLHDRRMLLVVDEMNGTPEAILNTVPNQLKGCEDYQFAGLGNPASHLDSHGQACKPEGGWGVVGEDTTSWRTTGVDKWELDPGVCLRYDGKQSPNVVLGVDKWPFLYTTADWARACDPRFEKTLAYWQMSRGLWPPEGQCRTILSEAALAKYDPEDGAPFRWISRKRVIAFLDPAFGGDDCMLYFAEVGDVEGGEGGQRVDRGGPGPVWTPGGSAREGVQVVHTMALTFEHAAKDERDYLVARQTIDECKLRGVKPEDFGLDRTGTGRGVAAIISAEWSSSIQQLEWGAMATDRPSSTADHRPAREVYSSFVTEIWWGVREFLEAGQLRGIPLQARIELTTREYELIGHGRYKLETKDKCKERLGYSPDDGDTLAGLVEVARRGGVVPDTPSARSTDTAWERLVARQALEAEGVAVERGSESVNDNGALDYRARMFGGAGREAKPLDMHPESVEELAGAWDGGWGEGGS